MTNSEDFNKNRDILSEARRSANNPPPPPPPATPTPPPPTPPAPSPIPAPAPIAAPANDVEPEPGNAVVVSDYKPKRSQEVTPAPNSDHHTSITLSTGLRPTKTRTLRAGVKAIGWALLAALLGLGWWFGSPEQQRAIAPSTTTEPPLAPIADDFNRLKSVPLDGISGESIQWTRLGEPFVAVDGVATVADGDGSTSIALIGIETADGRVGAEMAWAATGSGIVYRYEDESNYWSLISVPDFGTWNLTLTVDGEILRSWPTGVSDVGPGTQIAVDARGAESRVFINGELKLTVLDETFSNATGTGIIAKSGSQAAVSNFSVTPHSQP